MGYMVDMSSKSFTRKTFIYDVVCVAFVYVKAPGYAY